MYQVVLVMLRVLAHYLITQLPLGVLAIYVITEIPLGVLVHYVITEIPLWVLAHYEFIIPTLLQNFHTPLQIFLYPLQNFFLLNIL